MIFWRPIWARFKPHLGFYSLLICRQNVLQSLNSFGFNFSYDIGTYKECSYLIIPSSVYFPIKPNRALKILRTRHPSSLFSSLVNVQNFYLNVGTGRVASGQSWWLVTLERSDIMYCTSSTSSSCTVYFSFEIHNRVHMVKKFKRQSISLTRTEFYFKLSALLVLQPIQFIWRILSEKVWSVRSVRFGFDSNQSSPQYQNLTNSIKDIGE